MTLIPDKKFTSEDVLDALRAKHAEDLFVPECKNGPSHSEMFKLDAWVMNRSWANACVTGYEIKVSRSDFVRDEKWRAYLPMCNQLYFACPAGLIAPEEVGPEVGLCYLANTGTRMLTKKKAPFRNVTIPENVWRYILMCRVRVERNSYGVDGSDPRVEWQKLIAQKAEDRELGYQVARAIRETADKHRIENERLTKLMLKYDDVRAILVKLGLAGEWFETYQVERRISELNQVVPPHLPMVLASLIHDATKLQTELKKLQLQDQKAA